MFIAGGFWLGDQFYWDQKWWEKIGLSTKQGHVEDIPMGTLVTVTIA